jgi:hypothetical protein
VTFGRLVVFSGYAGFLANKPDHNITGILLKVAVIKMKKGILDISISTLQCRKI